MANQERRSPPIKFKIDVTKLLKDHFFHGKKKAVIVDGKEVMKGPIYADCAAWPNRDGEDDYGNTHYIVQELSKEAREADPKARGPIVGNLKVPNASPPPAAKRPAAQQNAPAANAGQEEDDDKLGW